MEIKAKSIFIVLLPTLGLVLEMVAVLTPSLANFQISVNETRFIPGKLGNSHLSRNFTRTKSDRICNYESTSVSYGLWFFRSCMKCNYGYQPAQLNLVSSGAAFKCFHATYENLDEIRVKIPTKLGSLVRKITRKAKLELQAPRVEATTGLMLNVIGTVAFLIFSSRLATKCAGVIAFFAIVTSGTVLSVATGMVESSVAGIKTFVISLDDDHVNSFIPIYLIVAITGIVISFVMATVIAFMFYYRLHSVWESKETRDILVRSDTLSEIVTYELTPDNESETLEEQQPESINITQLSTTGPYE